MSKISIVDFMMIMFIGGAIGMFSSAFYFVSTNNSLINSIVMLLVAFIGVLYSNLEVKHNE